MIVNCDVVDCINNKNCKCTADSIDLGLNHDSDGVCHIECTNYIYDPDWRKGIILEVKFNIPQKPKPRMVTIGTAVKDELMVKLAEQTEFRPAIKAIEKEICSRPHRSWDLFNLPVWEVKEG